MLHWIQKTLNLGIHGATVMPIRWQPVSQRFSFSLFPILYSEDDPVLLNNAPLCLQLVAKRNADEVVMQALKEIEKVLPLRN